jgi:hypothetical protein
MDESTLPGRRATLLGSAIVMLFLTACSSPQEQCIRAATQELRTVTALIAETGAAIARGYGYELQEAVRFTWIRCDFEDPEPDLAAPVPMCWEPYSTLVKRPVAIDPAVEERKLAGLKSRQKTLQTQADLQISNCRARFPDPK